MTALFLGSLLCVLVLSVSVCLWSIAKAWEWSDDIYGDDYDARNPED